MTHKKIPHHPHEIDPKQYKKGQLPAHYKKPTHGPKLKEDTRSVHRKKKR